MLSCQIRDGTQGSMHTVYIRDASETVTKVIDDTDPPSTLVEYLPDQHCDTPNVSRYKSQSVYTTMLSHTNK